MKLAILLAALSFALSGCATASTVIACGMALMRCAPF